MQPLCQNASLHNTLSIHFVKQVARFLRGILFIPFFVLNDFFSFRTGDQRKEAKERRLVIVDSLIDSYLDIF
jgi:restriction endonuclease